MRKDFSFEDDRKDKATCYESNCSDDHYGSENHSSASPNPKNTFIEDVKKFALAQQNNNANVNRQSCEMKVIFNDEDGNMYEGEM